MYMFELVPRNDVFIFEKMPRSEGLGPFFKKILTHICNIPFLKGSPNLAFLGPRVTELFTHKETV